MNDSLSINIYKAVNSLKIINETELEIIICKLLIKAENPMIIEEIINELFFINKKDREKLRFILNYYDFIHLDKDRYYYSQEDKDLSENVANIMCKIKYLEQLDVYSLVFQLLSKLEKPLSIHDIKNHLSIFINVDEEELEKTINNCTDFKIVEYKTYALSSWNNYAKFSLKFDDDILDLRNRSKISIRNWAIFKEYLIDTEKKTLQEVGDKQGITRERARQIIKRVTKKVKHFNYKKNFMQYIYFINDLLQEYGVICLGYRKHTMKLEKVFENWNPIEAVNLLNIIKESFVIIDDNYIYKKDKYENILHYIDFIVEKLGEKSVDIKYLDDIYKELKIEKWREKELLTTIIKKDIRFYLNPEDNVCYFSKNNFDRYCILYMIFKKIGEPVHYSVVMEEYIKITGKETEPRLILSYFDRRKDLFVRTFTGIYGLREWGYDEHVFAVDLAVQLLEEKKCAMHYEDIYNFLKDRTMAKKNTFYTMIQADQRIASLGFGFFGLASQIQNENGDIKYYSNIVQKDNKRRLGYLLGKYTNEYGNVIIVYRIVDTIINSYSMKIPKIFNIVLYSDVCIFDKDHNRYDCSYNTNENSLYGINRVFKRKDLSGGDIIVLEFISANVIRIFTKYEYDHEYEAFDYEKYEKYIDANENTEEDIDLVEVTDVESLLKYGLKHGFVYYEDLKNIDISEKYDDAFELMVDFNDRGITFLNKG